MIRACAFIYALAARAGLPLPTLTACASSPRSAASRRSRPTFYRRSTKRWGACAARKCRRRVAATPRLRRGNSVVETGARLRQPFSIPDVHIDTHVAEPFGHITLDLTDIQVTGFHLANATLGLPTSQPETGASVELDLDGLQLDVDCAYKWRKVHLPRAETKLGETKTDFEDGSRRRRICAMDNSVETGCGVGMLSSSRRT